MILSSASFLKQQIVQELTQQRLGTQAAQALAGAQGADRRPSAKSADESAGFAEELRKKRGEDSKDADKSTKRSQQTHQPGKETAQADDALKTPKSAENDGKDGQAEDAQAADSTGAAADATDDSQKTKKKDPQADATQVAQQPADPSAAQPNVTQQQAAAASVAQPFTPRPEPASNATKPAAAQTSADPDPRSPVQSSTDSGKKAADTQTEPAPTLAQAVALQDKVKVRVGKDGKSTNADGEDGEAALSNGPAASDTKQQPNAASTAAPSQPHRATAQAAQPHQPTPPPVNGAAHAQSNAQTSEKTTALGSAVQATALQDSASDASRGNSSTATGAKPAPSSIANPLDRLTQTLATGGSTTGNGLGAQTGSQCGLPGSNTALNALVESAQQANQPMSPQLAQALQVQAARGLVAAANNQTGVLTVRLNPQILGQLKVQVAIEGKSVKAKFEVSSSRAKSTLSKSIDALHDALDEHGLSLDDLNIAVAPRLPVRDAGLPPLPVHADGGNGGGGAPGSEQGSNGTPFAQVSAAGSESPMSTHPGELETLVLTGSPYGVRSDGTFGMNALA